MSRALSVFIAVAAKQVIKSALQSRLSADGAIYLFHPCGSLFSRWWSLIAVPIEEESGLKRERSQSVLEIR